ncbi:MAG TPA: hypothetical protein EYH32_04710 [Anaerolineae bacterium]|nr:hypothetical protein [Anaerolineae bacterium]
MKEVIYDIETQTAFHDHPGGQDDPSRRSGQALARLGMSIAATWGDRETRGQGDKDTRRPIACRLPIISKVTLSPPLLVSLSQLAEGPGTSKAGNGLLAVEWWKARQALMGIADILSDPDDGQRVMQLADHFYRRLKHYCIADVELTRDVYRFGLENGFVCYCYHGERYQVTVDWRPDAPRPAPWNTYSTGPAVVSRQWSATSNQPSASTWKLEADS